jgi:hypothetical protein
MFDDMVSLLGFGDGKVSRDLGRWAFPGPWRRGCRGQSILSGRERAGLATALLAAFLEALLPPGVARVLLHDRVTGFIVRGRLSLDPADSHRQFFHVPGDHLAGRVPP